MRKKNEYIKVLLLQLAMLLIGGNTLLWCTFAFALPPDTLWTKTFGGTEYDEARSVQQTSDGGYIIVGNTESYGAGGYDIYLIKTDENGDVEWTKIYGSPDYEYGYCVQQTVDNGYIISGEIFSFDTEQGYAYLLKTDVSGDILWTRTYGIAEKRPATFSVTQTSDRGYILAGCQDGDEWWNQDFYVVKTDSIGDTLWTKTFESEYAHCDVANSVQQTSKNDYVIAGLTGLQGSPVWDIYVVKLDAAGNTLWENTYGAGGIYSTDFGYEIQETSDRGYIVVGASDSTSNGIFNMCLMKLNLQGEKLWLKVYGGVYDDFGASVQQTSDEGYIVAGYKGTSPYPDNYRVCFLVKTDARGDTIWTRSYGSGTGYDGAVSVKQTDDEGFIVAGNTTTFGAGNSDFWLLRLEAEPGVEEHESINSIPFSLQVMPNPFANMTNIKWQATDNTVTKIEIYDAAGRLVRTLPINQPTNSQVCQISWDGKDDIGEELPGGIYFLNCTVENCHITEKLVLLR